MAQWQTEILFLAVVWLLYIIVELKNIVLIS